MRSGFITITAILALLTAGTEVAAQTAAASADASKSPVVARATPQHTGWATLVKGTRTILSRFRGGNPPFEAIHGSRSHQLQMS